MGTNLATFSELTADIPNYFLTILDFQRFGTTI